MSESVAPKAAQDDEADSERQDSTERLRIVSDVPASTGDDEDWLDGCDTVPAPRDSTTPTKPASAPPRPVAEPPPEQAEAIRPAPIVNIAAAKRSSRPPPRVDEQPAPLVTVDSDAPSISAQVVPIRAERPKNRRKKKKARPAVLEEALAKESAKNPVPAPRREEGSSAGRWLLALAVVGVAGLWFISRSGSEEAPPVEPQALVVAAPKVEATEVEAPIAVAPSEPVRPEEVVPPAATAPDQAPLPAVAPPSEGGRESARLTAFKAVVEGSKGARTCRHRGDAPGKVGVVVEFGNDGQVQRTNVKSAFANPMTSQCIASRLNGVTIPAFSGAPILITADVSLR